MELNKDQKLAVESINRNVSVIAGAGTGKTKVLTERFIRILDFGNLDEGKEIESIVAITFTKKATQEMIHRIRSEIRKNFPVNPKWRRYYRDMEKSNISTIHSFCARILRENPVEANIDPLFEVLEDNKASRLLKESIRDILKANIREENKTFDVIKNFELINIELLVNTFYKLYIKIRTVGMSFPKVKNMSLKYLKDLKGGAVDIDNIKNTFIYLMDRLPKNSKIYKLRNNPIWLAFEKGHYNKDEEFEIIKYLYDNIGSSSKEPEKMDFLRKSIEDYLLAKEYDNIHIYDVVLNLLIEVDDKYTYEKNTLKALDYEDLEIKVLNLLDNKNIRERYQKKFKYIMIDEFQDTNELQKNIFYKLATEKDNLDKSNLFIVGDPNQSIYGFRGADLDVFYDVVGDIRNITGQEPIVIKVNYRTVNTVLDFINHTFTTLMGEGYTNLASFKSSDEIDVEIFEKEDLEIPPGIDASSYHRYYEAELIAKRIKQLVESGRYRYRDFSMLFRATTRNHIYEKALNKYGIPYYNFGGKGFFQQQEILDVINALKAISNSHDTIAFIGFLRSPMIGMSDTTIYWILRQRENTVLNSMKKIIENKTMSGEETEKIRAAVDTIQYLIDYKTFHGLSDTINEIISKTYFIESLLLKQGGRQGVANINKLKEMVKKYEKDNIGLVEDLVDLFDELKELDEAQGRVESEDADVVSILTIHKSKGLQFPVVIIPEMATSRNSTFEDILFSKDKGIGIKLNSGRRIYDNIRENFSYRESEELKRVLYVAMTRAEEMLILGFQGKNSGFKRMIKEIIHPLPHKIVSEIQMAEEVSAPVMLIDNKFLEKKSQNNIDLPLLFDVPQFNGRRIERFSISQYLTFIQCNRKFYLDYYWKLGSQEFNAMETPDEFNLDSLQKGNLIHKFSEYYRIGTNPEALLEKVCISNGIPYERKIYDQLKTFIDNYIEQYRDDYEKVYIERPFYLKLQNSYIKGFIDRINIKDNRAEIIDYKTNKVVNKERLGERYTPQLQLYAHVVKEIMGIEVERARIIFLENGDYFDVPLSHEDLEKNLDNIARFIDFVSNNNELTQYRKIQGCNEHCKHKDFCLLGE